MMQVATLTMNPALDLSTTVDEVLPFRKLRCEVVRRDPGGGGINAARVIARLGGRSTALFPVGGLVGQVLKQLVEAEGVASMTVPIAGDTREDFSVFERNSKKQFRFVAPGPHVAESEWRACLDAFTPLCQNGGFAIVSGSLPPGAPPDFFAEVARIAKARGTKLTVDTSGASLAAAVREGIFLVKPNQQELADLAGLVSHDTGELIAAARALVVEGRIEAIALSLAEEGAVLVTRGQCLRAHAPQVEALSTVGAGDSFLGALMWSIAQGHDWRDALRYGVAAGTAALLSPGTDLAHAQNVHALAKKVMVEEIA